MQRSVIRDRCADNIKKSRITLCCIRATERPRRYECMKKKNDNDSLMEFPCDFHIKIIGLNRESFATEVLSIVRNHFPNTEEKSVRSQESQQGII